MERVRTLFIFIVTYLYLFQWCAAGNCDGIKYKIIQDVRRSTAFHSTSLLCDRAIIRDGAWYRFQSEAGGEIPTAIPNIKSCGTFSPIWMKGSHPTVQEGKVNRQACANLNHRHPIGCGESYNISVVNCSGYYIYQLKKPTYCNVAYCAGSKLPKCITTVCPDNALPYFNMPSKFYAIQNRQMKIQINAVDPEAQLLKYSVLSANSTIEKASIDGDRRLTVYVANSGSVYVKIVDDVGQESVLAIHITAVRCPCKNGAKCRFVNTITPYPVKPPNYTCSCVKPYKGTFCEFNTEACANVPCFPGLKCSVTGDGFSCEGCPRMFEGDGINCMLKKKTEKTVTIKAEITVTDGLNWTNELTNKTSFKYKQVTSQITVEIIKIYVGIPEFQYVIITGYRKGSVIVGLELILDKQIDKPLEPLKRSIKKNGKLGTLEVDSGKLRKKHDPVLSSKKTIFGIHETVFIIVVILASSLSLIAIVAVAICIKRKKVNIIVLAVSEDRAEICPREGITTNTKVKNPSHNQVVDIATVKNSAFSANQCN